MLSTLINKNTLHNELQLLLHYTLLHLLLKTSRNKTKSQITAKNIPSRFEGIHFNLKKSRRTIVSESFSVFFSEIVRFESNPRELSRKSLIKSMVI